MGEKMTAMHQKWIKLPGPGQFRGAGEWVNIEDCGCTESDWQYNVATDYLPTAEQDEKPTDRKRADHKIAARAAGGKLY